MTEATEISTSPSRPKSKPVPALLQRQNSSCRVSRFQRWKFRWRFRELAEKSVSQAKETYEKLKSAAEEATDVLEETYATATKGASDYSLKMIEAARENTNAAFDFAAEIMTVKSLSEWWSSPPDTRASSTRPYRANQGAYGYCPESGD